MIMDNVCQGIGRYLIIMAGMRHTVQVLDTEQDG